MKELLIETNFSKLSPSNINESNNGNILVEGILATVEVKNGNGRYYSRELWEREMEKYNELIQQRRSLGELDHPSDSIINLKNVSHLITKWWWDNDHIMGKIEILPTPPGNILKELIKSGVTVGVSSRGMGSLEQRGEVMEVQDDFNLIAWDFVSTPSNPGSYMHQVNESLNKNSPNKNYSNINNIIRDIICSQTGVCNI